MTNSTANTATTAELIAANVDAAIVEQIAVLKGMAAEVRSHLAIKVVESHGYIVTRNGDAMDVRRNDDGTTSANMCIPTQATRWIKEDATTIATGFGEDNEGEWRAEYWRDAAARYVEHLDGMIARMEARIA